MSATTKLKVEMIDIPTGPARIAQRQTQDIIKYYAALAGFGSLDLAGLALSCYLQGAVDCIEAAKHHPHMLKLGEDS